MTRYIKGSICEFETSPSPVSKDGSVYINSLHKLYKIKHCFIDELYDFKEDVLFHFLEGGLWINRRSIDGHNKARYVDLFGIGVSYPDTDILISRSAIDVVDDLVIGFDYEADPSFLFIADVSKSSYIKSVGKYYGFSSDGINVFATDVVKDRVYCFDLNLEPIWSVYLEGMDFGDWTKTPQLFEDLVLVNHAFNIIAFSKENGQEVWRYNFDSTCGPTCCNLIGDRLYAECFGIGFIINPRNGEVIYEIPLGFKSSKYKQCVGIHFYPYQDKLVALSEHDDSVRVFSDDGSELLQELNLPKEYKISSNAPPVITEDAIYQSVYSRMAIAGGLLILNASDSDSGNEINIEPRPEIKIEKHQEQDNKHAYNIYVDATDADAIHRFAQITIKEIHMETGSMPYSDYLEYDGRDRQHNGHMNLFVDSGRCDETEFKRIQTGIRELENYFAELDRLAGDGENPIKVNVILKPKSEWDLGGESLNLKQLREMRWANEPQN